MGITGLPVRYLAHIARQVDIDTLLSWAHYNLLEDEINDELVPLSKAKRVWADECSSFPAAHSYRCFSPIMAPFT